MTSKDLSIFNSLRPFSIGFDDMFDQFENMLGNGNLTMQSNYPPYNIKKTSDNTYVIEVAVAGFGKQDIEIELDNGKMIIKGNVQNAEEEETFLFKGIANRAFTRAFTLEDQIEVKDEQQVSDDSDDTQTKLDFN